MTLGVSALAPSIAGAQTAATPQTASETPDSVPAEETVAENDGEPEQQSHEDAGEVDPDDVAPDALHDPVIAKLIKRRVVIDRPRFTLETGGKIQVQYFDSDSSDELAEDELFLRRLRPRLRGRLFQRWVWSFEVELSADIQSGDVDFNELDIRDLYVRYQGFRGDNWRLTLGNQKTPFSRDFLTPSINQLLVERTFVGDLNAGVPDRKLGVHFRAESRSGKLAYWASGGGIGIDPDSSRIRFDSLVGGSGNLNEGFMVSGRIDLHPRGAMTFNDGDPHTPEIKYTWSVAGYAWENDGRTNRFTEDGESSDPERVDLDSATGVEISGGLRGRGVSLDWQYNRVETETVVGDFTGGIYIDGRTRMVSAAIEGSYTIRRSPVELGGALAESEADGYERPWREATLQLNLRGIARQLGSKIQVSHTWLSNRFGIAEEDFRETRIQIQYVW
jgi:hypothetical protein